MNEMVHLEIHVINQNGSIMHMIVAIVKNTLKAQSPKLQGKNLTCYSMYHVDYFGKTNDKTFNGVEPP